MDSDERKEKNENRWKTWKVTLGWLTVNVENALERKWNVVSGRWKCVNFSSTLELDSLWVVVFQKQKNRKKKKCVIISTGRSKRKGSHFYWRLMPQRKVSPQRSGSDPFFLLCHALSSVPSLHLCLLCLPAPFLPFHILSLLPLPVSSLCVSYHPPSPTSLLHLFSSSTLHPVQLLLNLGSRRATPLNWWHCESIFLYISFRQRRNLQVILGSPGNLINEVVLDPRLGKGNWQPWRCWKLSSFPEVLWLTCSESCRLFRMLITKDVFWRLARERNREVGRNQFVMGPGWQAEELNW